ncbi:HAD family hydrolase [Paenibacillus arenilitoris]|uniref:HAD family hydrolase n=1 Tax=Paenibacillus arenilitoris TaxID=2772299 RepID=A0A927CP79_9BACL|nr:HAD-IA family hydrolase [Paenibacillus arenilitoris]MBD2870532.1 HAD family hydrolase [Paenibacillus arenilitoris]
MPQLFAKDARFNVQAILFDKDGTLMDFMYTWGYWADLLLSLYSRELEATERSPRLMDVTALWGLYRAPDGAIADYDRNGPFSMGTVGDILTLLAWQGYRSGLSWAEAAVLARQCSQAANEQLEQSRAARAVPDLVPFLEQCRTIGLPLAVVTADETAAAEKHLQWLGLRRYFSAVIGNDQVERGKPYPDMVELACRKLSVPAAQAAVIGDSNGDMLMAKSADAAAAIGITGPQDAGADHLPAADAVVSSYRELGFQDRFENREVSMRK